MKNDLIDLNYHKKLNEIVEKLSISLSNNYNNFNFADAIKRDIHASARKSDQLRNFYYDISKKRTKKSYVFYNQLSLFLAEEIKKKFKIKSTLTYESSYKEKVYQKIFFSYEIIQSFKKKIFNSKNILFITHNSKHEEYLKSIFGKNKKFYYFSTKNLKNYFLSKKDYPYFVSKKNFYLNKYIKFLNNLDFLTKQYKPKSIITVEGDNYFDGIIPSFCKNKNIKTICLQWGITAPLIRYIKDSKFGYKDYFKHDYYFSWGKIFTDELKKYNSNINFIEVGNPKIKKHTQKKKHICVIDCGISKYDENNVDIYIRFFKFIKICALSNKQIYFYIRLKNNYKNKEKRILGDLKKIKNIKYVSDTVDLGSILNKVKIVISTTSTALIEGLASKCIPVAYPGTSYLKWFKNFNKMKLGSVIKNEAQGLKMIEKLYSNNDNTFFKYNKKIVKFIDNSAKKKILKYVKDLVK